MTDAEKAKALLERLGWIGLEWCEGDPLEAEVDWWSGFPPYVPNEKHSESDWYHHGPGNYMAECPDPFTDIECARELVKHLCGKDGIKRHGEFARQLAIRVGVFSQNDRITFEAAALLVLASPADISEAVGQALGLAPWKG